MRKIINKVKEMSLSAKLIIVFIYPILPLGLLAVWVLGSGFESIFFRVRAIETNEILTTVLTLLLFLGGPIGVYAIIRVFFNQITRLTFWLFLYGSIAYSFIAIVAIVVGFFSLDVLGILHALYLTITLSVIVKFTFKLYEQT